MNIFNRYNITLKTFYKPLGWLLVGILLVGLLWSACGCSAMTPASKSQSMTVTALGFPAITVVTTTTQTADNAGDDENQGTQTVTNDVKPDTDVDASIVPK